MGGVINKLFRLLSEMVSSVHCDLRVPNGYDVSYCILIHVFSDLQECLHLPLLKAV